MAKDIYAVVSFHAQIIVEDDVELCDIVSDISLVLPDNCILGKLNLINYEDVTEETEEYNKKHNIKPEKAESNTESKTVAPMPFPME